jgi:hypothetical protein
MKEPLQCDPIRVHQRKVTAERCVGVGAKCAACGETRPEALIRGSDPKICAEFQRRGRGHKTVDFHHFAKSANNPLTVPAPTNDHRADLTVAQDVWPKETRDNPDGSSLLAAAGCIRGFVDWVVYLIQKGVLCLQKCLRHSTSSWWINTGISGGWARRWSVSHRNSKDGNSSSRQ